MVETSVCLSDAGMKSKLNPGLLISVPVDSGHEGQAGSSLSYTLHRCGDLKAENLHFDTLSHFSPNAVALGEVNPISHCSIKPKFHYADFPVTSATSPRQTRDVPVDLSATSPTSPFARRKRAGCRLITEIFQTISTWGDGLKPQTSPSRESFGKTGVMEFGLNSGQGCHCQQFAQRCYAAVTTERGWRAVD